MEDSEQIGEINRERVCEEKIHMSLNDSLYPNFLKL